MKAGWPSVRFRPHSAGWARAAMVLVAAAGILATDVAEGQEPQPAPSQEARSIAARNHYERAAKLYEAGNLAAAIVELNRAYELRPSPKIQLTIAEVADELHDYATAVRAFEQFIQDSGDDIDPASQKHALDRLAELKTFVASLRSEINPPDARLTVDGEPIAKSAEPWLINVGRHRVLVEKEGYLPHLEVVTATAGEAITLRVALTEIGEPAKPKPPPPTPVPPAAAEKAEGPPEMTPLSFAGFGTAGGLLVAGTVTGVLALRADDRARNTAFAGSSPPASIQQDLDRANSLALATDLLMGGAIGVTLVTAYLTWWAPTKEEAPSRAFTHWRVGPTGAAVEGRF